MPKQRHRLQRTRHLSGCSMCRTSRQGYGLVAEADLCQSCSVQLPVPDTQALIWAWALQYPLHARALQALAHDLYEQGAAPLCTGRPCSFMQRSVVIQVVLAETCVSFVLP